MHAAVPVVGVLGLGGVAATATVSVLAVNGHFQQKANVWDALTLASTGNNSFRGKFGEDSKYHLIDTDSSSNNWYWDKIYKDVYLSRGDRSKSPSFQSTKIKNVQALKDACKGWYSKETSDILRDETGDKLSVWKYCSRIGDYPMLLSESQTVLESLNAGSIGRMFNNILVNTSLVNNRRFWQSQEDAFLNQGEPTDEVFKALYNKGKNGQKHTKANVSPLGEVCQEMYKQEASPKNKDLWKMIFKYCSITPNRQA